MKEKILHAFVEIDKNRQEIREIQSSGTEFYFIFRGRSFSVSDSSSGGVFYVYPRFHGGVVELAAAMERGIDHPDLIFVNVSDEDVGSNRIGQFYAWMQSKHLGIDDLLRDIGLDL